MQFLEHKKQTGLIQKIESMEIDPHTAAAEILEKLRSVYTK